MSGEESNLLSQKMERGTNALKAHMSNATTEMEIRQTRRGWFQELLGCEAKTEFQVFTGGNQIAHALEDSSCLCRLCCAACHPFTMAVNELNTGAELVAVERDFRCPVEPCKCCCFQEMQITSGGEELGSLKEDCWYCVPQFTVYGPNQIPVYKIHSPTCCGGTCTNYCTEGNPCFGRGCCKVPFRVYRYSQSNTDGDAPFVGKILKKPRSALSEMFTDADAFDINFPDDSTPHEKGLLIGSAIFINAVYFEGGEADTE